jgi:hypothetical protein
MKIDVKKFCKIYQLDHLFKKVSSQDCYPKKYINHILEKAEQLGWSLKIENITLFKRFSFLVEIAYTKYIMSY